MIAQAGSSEVLSQLTIESAQVKLDMNVLGKLTTNGGLVVSGPAEFQGPTLFKALAQFIGNVIFRDDVEFTGRPTFNKDTAGFALIKKGDQKVKIEFEKEYKELPVITINRIWEVGNDTLSMIEKLKGFFIPSQDYVLAGVTAKGFTIVLEDPSVTDLKFSWIAIAVDQMKTYESSSSGQVAGASIDFSQIKPSPWTDAGLADLSPSSANPTLTLGIILSPTPTSISVSPTPTVTILPTLTPTLVPQKTVTVLPNEYGFVRLREAPSTESAEIGQLTVGGTYPYREKRYDWYLVEAEGKEGWISGTYVEEVKY